MEEIALSNKDRDILFELSMDGRASITALAKRVKMSKQSLSYRLELLQKNKVILGYYAITNIYLLGMTHYRIFITYQDMTKEKEEEFIATLMHHPKIPWIAYLDGDQDVAFLIWARHIREFEEVFNEINEHHGKYFKEKIFSVATRIDYLKYKFLNGKSSRSSLVFGDCQACLTLDALDKGILQELNKDGRATLVYLANKYNTSAKVIKTRIDRLMKNKIIVGFNVKIDHNKLGFTHRKIFLQLKNASQHERLKLDAYLKDQKSTIYLVRSASSYDYEFEVMTASNNEFHEIMKSFRSAFAYNIKDYSAVIIYDEPKSGQLFTF
jgi:Lrp/AsnC family transcriptional regulator, leucine-responsive regulatory protein